MNPERNAPERARAGRDGLLRLAFERSGAATVLRRSRFTLPLQVLAPHTLDDGTLYLLLLNPTGGVLGGDNLRTEITVGEGGGACISTASATRIYRTACKVAEVETTIEVGRGGTLEYLPDHIIPHAGSSLRQSLRVEMAEGSRAIFFDGFASGRVALGERWNFRDFDSRMEIYLRGRLLYANRTKIAGQPAEAVAATAAPSPSAEEPLLAARSCASPAALGRMSDYTYCGSLLLIADEAGNDVADGAAGGSRKTVDWRAALAALRGELEAMPEILGGASLLSHSGCSVRFLARSAIEFSGVTQRLWSAARRHVLHLPALSLRKY